LPNNKKMKLKILLLNPPGKYLYVRDYFCSKISKADYINAPIDLVMISGVLNTGEFDLKVIDAVAEKIPVGNCLRKISEFNPNAIIVLIGSASLAEDKEFLNSLKEKIPAEIFVIGDFLLTESNSFLEEFDFVKGVILNFTSDGIYRQLKGEKEKIKDMAVRDCGKIIFYPKMMFLKNILQGRGFTFSMLQSLHSFLGWSKEWELTRKTGQAK